MVLVHRTVHGNSNEIRYLEMSDGTDRTDQTHLICNEMSYYANRCPRRSPSDSKCASLVVEVEGAC